MEGRPEPVSPLRPGRPKPGMPRGYPANSPVEGYRNGNEAIEFKEDADDDADEDEDPFFALSDPPEDFLLLLSLAIACEALAAAANAAAASN